MKTRKLWAGILAAVLLLAVVPVSHAETSDQILEEIADLQDEYSQSQDRMNELEAQLDANWESIEDMVEYKNGIDEQIFLLYSELDNLDQQIAIYTQLIADTQLRLEEAQAELDELNQKYKARIRAMEEAGTVSYWTVIFKSTSFTDLIDRLNMMQEIAELDQKMMEQLETAARAVSQAKTDLENEKTGLESARIAQAEALTEMEEKRVEADEILAQLNENQQELEAEQSHCSDANNALIEQIAQAELNFYNALQAEEEERRRQEEERQNQATEPEETEPPVQATEPENTEPPVQATEPEETEPPVQATEPEETEPEAPKETEPEESGWLQPCTYTYISSSYGYRSSGFHNGVDFAAPKGTPIYATRSGTVTTATALKDSKGNYISYGNYVVINHGDGFSSLYAHMSYYVVEAGQEVTQGQLIGYVGSTGNSTGNHLHFTVFYKGSTVNPMNYL